MKKMQVKAQAGVIIIILIILVVIGLIVVVWNFVYPFVTEESKKIEIESLSTSLQIKEAVFFVTGASKISVGAGKDVEGLDSLKFVFQGERENYVEIVKEVPKAFETRTYSFSPDSRTGKVKKISVIPMFGENSGREFDSNEIKLFEIPAGMISWWRFNEGIEDFADGNNIALKNNAKIENEILILDGNSYADAGNNFSIIDKFSFNAWINTNENKGTLIERGDISKNFEISLTSDRKINFSYMSGENIFSNYSDDSLKNGWNHVAVSIDWSGDKNARIYINDALSLKFMGQNLDFSNESIFIGKNFNGEMDEIMVFNGSLNSEQMQGLFEQTKK